MKNSFRIERDYLCMKKIPYDALYGISTLRARENFPVSNLHLPKELTYAIVQIKRAAALVNAQRKLLSRQQTRAILRACDDILNSKFNAQFPLDVYQAGAGTSQHMNVNEVIANRALEILGKKKGSYRIIDPHNHVNLGQSTNDVFHSAIHVAAFLTVRHKLLPALNALSRSLTKKTRRWRSIIKTGRTHLRDAVPMTLGQEFSGYAAIIKKREKEIKQASASLLELNLGGTAIGTGITAPRDFGKDLIHKLNHSLKTCFRQSRNLFEGTQSLAAIAALSSALKVCSLSLIQFSHDLRLLSSGPATGLNELRLPAAQPGSSIMPAKVNPSIPEMMEMICFQVIGNDETIALATQAGELELNVMMPVAAYNLLLSIEILSNGVHIFQTKCIDGIEPNIEVCRSYVERNPIAVTVLAPHIGYDKAAEIAQRAYREHTSIREILLREHILTQRQYAKLFTAKGFSLTSHEKNS